MAVTPLVFADIWRFFHFLRQNINEEVEHKVFVTQNSLKLNLSKYFGHRTDFLNERLYMMLSDGKPCRRIFIDDFIEKFYQPLWEADDPLARARFMFTMLDFDGDGYLLASDLVRALELIDGASDFGQEFQKIVDFYVTTHLKTNDKPSEYHKINLHKYKSITEKALG